jgi:hypothetical protein
MSVFRFLAKSQGACCPAEYVKQTRREPPQQLADFLGVHVRTVNAWRLKVKRGKTSCERKPNCPYRLNAEPLILPRQRRTPQPIRLDSVPASQSDQPQGLAELPDVHGKLDDTGEDKA